MISQKQELELLVRVKNMVTTLAPGGVGTVALPPNFDPVTINNVRTECEAHDAKLTLWSKYQHYNGKEDQEFGGYAIFRKDKQNG